MVVGRVLEKCHSCCIGKLAAKLAGNKCRRTCVSRMSVVSCESTLLYKLDTEENKKCYIPQIQFPLPYLVLWQTRGLCIQWLYPSAIIFTTPCLNVSPFTDNCTRWGLPWESVCLGVSGSTSSTLPQLRCPRRTKLSGSRPPRVARLCCHSCNRCYLSCRITFRFQYFFYSWLLWTTRQTEKQTRTVCSLRTSWTSFMTSVKGAS